MESMTHSEMAAGSQNTSPAALPEIERSLPAGLFASGGRWRRLAVARLLARLPLRRLGGLGPGRRTRPVVARRFRVLVKATDRQSLPCAGGRARAGREGGEAGGRRISPRTPLTGNVFKGFGRRLANCRLWTRGAERAGVWAWREWPQRGRRRRESA